MSRAARRLLQVWKERIHPAATKEQVALAFALLAGGAVLSILGVLVFALGDLILARPSWLRELGILAAAAGLPVFLTGFVVALPARPWLRALSGLGVVLGALALVLFTWLYPDSWHVTVRGPNGFVIVTYLVGVSAEAAAAAAAVGTYFVERDRPRGTKGYDPFAEPDRPVTRDEIDADLAWADQQGWNWGGVRGSGERNQLKLRDEAPLELRGLGPQVHVIETPGDQGVSQAVATLGNLRGTKRDDHDSHVDSQVSFLRELKAQQAAEERARQNVWWRRLLRKLRIIR